jgi:hypothetical protein
MTATEVAKLQDSIAAPLEEQIVILQRMVKVQAELLKRIEDIVKSRVALDSMDVYLLQQTLYANPYRTL